MAGDFIIAMFDYEGQSDQELKFSKYDRFIVIDASDPDWLYVQLENSDKCGYVPANYLAPLTSLEIFDWYFGQINRREAESYLIDAPEGTFLIRDSTSNPGDFALSLKYKHPNRKMPVRHYIIIFQNGTYSIWKKKYFKSLWDLVNDYRENSNDLPICLLYPYHKQAPVMTDLSRETKKDWEIDRNEIEFKRELGSGNFGNVFYGLWKGKTEVAIKTLRKGYMTDEEFLQEATIMKDLKHPNIVGLFATCSKTEPIYIITPFMKNGALYNLLRSQQKPFNLDQLLEFAFQISKGMHYLETKMLIHCDLAARNVLVDGMYTCKIADFGLAKMLKGEDDLNCSSGKIPVKWSAPEVIFGGSFSIKSDVWSFGIVVIELFAHGETLYKGMNKEEIRREVFKGYRLPKPDNCPPEIYEVLLKCWSQEPSQRPSFRLLKDYLDDTCNRVVDGITYLEC